MPNLTDLEIKILNADPSCLLHFEDNPAALLDKTDCGLSLLQVALLKHVHSPSLTLEAVVAFRKALFSIAKKSPEITESSLFEYTPPESCNITCVISKKTSIRAVNLLFVITTDGSVSPVDAYQLSLSQSFIALPILQIAYIIRFTDLAKTNQIKVLESYEEKEGAPTLAKLFTELPFTRSKISLHHHQFLEVQVPHKNLKNELSENNFFTFLTVGFIHDFLKEKYDPQVFLRMFLSKIEKTFREPQYNDRHSLNRLIELLQTPFQNAPTPPSLYALCQYNLIINTYSSFALNDGLSVWSFLAANPESRAGLIAHLNKYPDLLSNPQVVAAFSAVRPAAAGPLTGTSVWHYLAAYPESRAGLIAYLNQHPDLLSDPQVVAAFSAVRPAAAGSFAGTSVWYYLAGNPESRGWLIAHLNQHPDLLSDPQVVAAFSAVRPATAGPLTGTSVWHLLATYSESRGWLITHLNQHPALLCDPQVVAAFSAVRPAAAGSFAGTSVWYYLATYPESRLWLIDHLKTHPELLDNPDVLAAFSAIPPTAAGSNAGKSLWYFLAVNQDSRHWLIEHVKTHPNLLDNPAVLAAFSAAGPDGKTLGDLLKLNQTSNKLNKIFKRYPSLLTTPTAATALSAHPAKKLKYNSSAALFVQRPIPEQSGSKHSLDDPNETQGTQQGAPSKKRRA